MKIRAKIIVEGKVQGVGYRDFVDRIATELGLTGQVENLKGKSVGIICEGSKEVIEKFLKAINIDKYPVKVSNIKVEYDEATGEFSDFSIIWEEDLTKAVFERMGLAAGYLQDVSFKIDNVKEAVDNVGNKVDASREENKKGFTSLGGKMDNVGSEVKTLRIETKKSFHNMDVKYDKISNAMINIVEELRKDRKEAKVEMHELIQAVLRVAEK